MVHLFGMKTIIQVAALRDHEKRLREADAERDHQIDSLRNKRDDLEKELESLQYVFWFYESGRVKFESMNNYAHFNTSFNSFQLK